MTEAIFTLIGVAIGSFASLLADAIGARRNDRREHHASLREACAGIGSAISAMKQATYDRWEIDDDGVEMRFRAAHSSARAHYEQLRLTSSSIEAQEAARFAIRYALGFWLQAGGEELRPDEADKGPLIELEARMQKLYTEVRTELGLADPSLVYSEPETMLRASEDES